MSVIIGRSYGPTSYAMVRGILSNSDTVYKAI